MNARAGGTAWPTHPWQDWRQGFATVLAAPWLWISIAVFGLSNITLAGPYAVAMPFLVRDSMKADVGMLGLLYAEFALGFVIGGVWLGRVTSIDSLGSFGLLPIGLAPAGWATERVGPPAVFVVVGLLTAFISVAALAHPAIRRLD